VVLPVSDYRVSAGFGAVGRLWSSRHTGLDLSLSYGSPVKSMSSGEVIWSGYDGPYGNKVVIEHWNGTEIWYCHLSRILQRSGEVKPGTEIGKVGSSNSTDPTCTSRCTSTAATRSIPAPDEDHGLTL
jgi:murein DD-endopeptidase MepM/ murein hydrolase activator NlpD